MSLLQSFVPSLSRSSTPASSVNADAPSLRPVYEVKETPEAYGLTVYLPGVAKDGLELTVDNDVIAIKGRRTWKAPAEWAAIYRESSSLSYALNLQHDQAVDAEKVAAELKDGVLRVSLPKAEAVKPRKIEVA